MKQKWQQAKRYRNQNQTDDVMAKSGKTSQFVYFFLDIQSSKDKEILKQLYIYIVFLCSRSQWKDLISPFQCVKAEFRAEKEEHKW